jgi:hypothetical protein
MWLCVLGCAVTVQAQTLETVGARALGMGGAFVAVANDNSATWWNPAAPAAGPFFDFGVGWAGADTRHDGEPVGRRHATAVSLVTPPLGVSYYRFRITDIQGDGPTVAASGGREEGRAGVVRALQVNDLGVTLLTTVFSGVHVGTTLKFLRGSVEHTTADSARTPSALLDAGDALSGGRSQNQFDADVGGLAVVGPFRFGGVVRNLREAKFDELDGPAGDAVRLARQARVGVAFDGAQRRASTAAWLVSADVDVVRYATGTGDRRVIAAGAERWLFGERLGIRGGGRFNQVCSSKPMSSAADPMMSAAGGWPRAWRFEAPPRVIYAGFASQYLLARPAGGRSQVARGSDAARTAGY